MRNWIGCTHAHIPPRHLADDAHLVSAPLTHPDNSSPINPPPNYLPIPVGGGVAHAYPLPTRVFHGPLGRPVRLTGWPDSGVLPDRLPGRLSDSQIAGKHPSGADRRSCRANPLGQPAGARAGRTFCDPRTSCGRLYVLLIRWLLLECVTVGHRCVLTLPVMLQNWR